jgi:hypothetical protein
MTDFSLAGSVIERLGRAMCAQLSLLTGTRAEGVALVKATGAPVALPQNTYAVPITSTANEQFPVKTMPNPATAEAHLQGGDWTVTAAGLPVRFRANVGGAMGNWPAGTRLRFVPEVPGLEVEAIVQAPGFEGGVTGPVKQVVVYDDFPSADLAKAMFQGKVQGMPALVLAWVGSAPIEGRTAGISQGATRKARGVRAYFENFVLYTLCSDSTSGETRRKIALEITEAARAVLGDHKVNIDGERISGLGTGLEILSSARMPKKEQALPMLTNLRVVSVRRRVDVRTFEEWQWTRYKAFKEAVAPDPDEGEAGNAEELTHNDLTDPMP